MFPPHARGWTRMESEAAPSTSVSPARAGMDRCGGLRRLMPDSFPRTRGDGPGC